MPSFSNRSLLKLATVHPDLQTLFHEVIKEYDCTVIYGVRSLGEQQGLYAQGRTIDGNIVTNCDGVEKRSKHQDGYAVDVVPWPVDWKDFNRIRTFGWYVKGIAQMLKRCGKIDNDIRWGGDWHRFVDYPHFEI